MKFYFPPMNKFGNQAFRSLVFENGADFAFTEMIRIDKLLEDDEVQLRKVKVELSQISQTIFQILAEDISLIKKGVLKLKKLNPEIREINYNMGCPQSSLCKNFNGGGILKNQERLIKVAENLFEICNLENVIPSIKIRIGVTRDEVSIYDNLKIFEKIGIKKVYIHGRTLDDGYVRPSTINEIKKCTELFPNMTIILNGDIVGSQSFNKVRNFKIEGVAIGRAALENPKIFQDLKDEKNFEFNPSGENLESRKILILNYLGYAKKYNLNNSYIKANLSYLTRNCIGASELRKKINQVNTVEEIVNILNKI